MAATTIPEYMNASAMTMAKSPVLDPDGYIIPERFDKAFANDRYVSEEKLDGHRCLVIKKDGTVWTPLQSIPSLPEHIADIYARFPDGIYDGELIVPGGISTDVVRTDCRHKLVHVLFDVLECHGIDTLKMTLAERRGALDVLIQIISKVAPNQTAVRLIEQTQPSWAHVKSIWARGGEGVIVKDKRSLYRPGYRTPEWLKVKRLEHHTVTCCGFEAGSSGPTSVVLFVFDDGTPGRCKNRNKAELLATAAKPDKYIGRRLVIYCQQRLRGQKKPRHPMFDHWAGDGE